MISYRTRVERGQIAGEGFDIANALSIIVSSLLTGVGMGLGFYLINKYVARKI